MKKQILTLLAVVALCLGLLPIAASAANAQLTNLVVGGVTVVEDGQTTQTTSGDGWSYDVDSNTLTLNGAHLDQAYTLPSLQSGPTGVIYAQGSSGTLTVNVIGDSQITASEENVNGIYLGTVSTPENPNPSFSLVLTGSAKLDIDVNGAGNAISATTDITVEKLTLEANIMDENNGGNVFFAGGKTIIQENANLDLYAANNPAIYGGTGVEISGGTVTVEAPKSNPIYSSGGDVTITGSANVTATGYYGIVGTNVTISGSAVVDTTSTADCGIYTPGALTISETADVIANGYYAALRGNTGVNITGGKVEAVSTNDCGIFSQGQIAVSGTTTDLTASSMASGQGIRAEGGIEITGGAVKAISQGDAAIYAKDCDMHIGGDAVVTCSADFTGFAVVVGSSSSEQSLAMDGNAKLIATNAAGDGIFTGKDFTVGGSATVETTSTYSYGAVTFSDNAHITANTGTFATNAICAVGKLTISGSGVSVTATSEAEPTTSGATFPAIMGFDGIEISDGSQVNAKGTHSSAIQASNGTEIQIKGSGTTVTAATDANDQAGVFGTGAVSIQDGAVVDTSDAPTGLYTNSTSEKIIIKDSWVNSAGNNSDIEVSNSVIFQGDTGEVYGNATVSGDVEVPEGKTLNVPGNTTLTVQNNTTLTNNGTINVQSQGTVTNNGTIVGDIKNAGTTTNNGIIQGTVTGEGSTTNNGGISEDGGQSFSVNTLDALQGIIDNSVDSTDAVIIVLGADITGDLTIPVNANVVIDGGSPYTISGTITCSTSTTSTDVTNLTLRNLTMDGSTGSKNWAVISQNQGTKNGDGKIVLTGVNSLNLTMNNCTVQNYVKKALYLTNAKNLTISGCIFENNATGKMGDPNISGDYTIDLNLCGVQDTVATITNSTFTDDCGDKAVIKMAVRGGESDGDATDVPLNSTQGNSAASAKSLTISGCTFSDSPAATADVNIGTDSKKVKNGEKFTENTTGAYTVTLSNNKTAVTVFDASKTYKTDDGYYLAEGGGTEKAESITVPAGKTAMKTPNGDLTIESNTGGITTPTEPEEPEEDSWPFVDVTEDAWYYEAVKYVYENGLMIGTADDTFAPNSTLSRAMVAQILYNLEGQPTADGESTFTDASGHWAANAIAWAQETGVVSGYENNTFRPNRAVTREELAQMLYNYAQYKDYDLTATGDLSQFSDGDKVQDWAEEAVSWANGNGLINGHDDGTLEPGGNATRAQAASILMNFDLNLVEE